MTLHVHRTTVPAGTPLDAPVGRVVDVSEVVVHRVGAYFPPGTKATVQAGLYFGESRVWPGGAGDDAQGVGWIGPTLVETVIAGSPNTLEWRFTSPSSTRPHDVITQVSMRPSDGRGDPVRIVGFEGGRGTARPGVTVNPTG